MKKLLPLLFLLLGFSFTAHSQKKILFNIEYKPQMLYQETIEQTSAMTMKYSGSEDFIKGLKEKGVENPTIKNSNSVMKMDIKTDKLVGKEYFPLLMDFKESKSSDEKKPIPDGTLIYGHCIPGKTPMMDSIVSKEMNDEVKKVMLPVMQSMLSQLTFPKREMKVGESFTDKTPLSIPIGGLSLDMDITTTYKLLSVTNGMGNFDIKQVYTMKTAIEKYKITASGSGKGTMTYDIANSFFTQYSLENTMTMKMKMDQFNLDLSMVNQSNQNVKISANK